MNGYRMYIGTDSVRNSKGIYTVDMNENGAMRVISTMDARDPGYICLSHDRSYLYATIECMNYRGRACAAASAYRVDSSGRLNPINEVAVEGQLNAHVCLDHTGTHLITSGYLSGTVSLLPIGSDGRLNEARYVLRNPVIDGRIPSVHCCMPTPDGRVCVCEAGLGLLQLFSFDGKELHPDYTYKTEAGRHLRHFCFHPSLSILYAIDDLKKEILTFAYRPNAAEQLKKLQTVSTMPENTHQKVVPAAIHVSPDGSMLVGSVRAWDPQGNILSVYRIDAKSGLLELTDKIITPGMYPREFAFSPDGKFLVVGTQWHDNLASYIVDYANGTLRLVEVLPGIDCPTCIVFA